MQQSEVVVTTLDQKMDVVVDLKEMAFLFTVRPHEDAAAAGRGDRYEGAREVIEALQRRGYQYAEDLIRLAVSAVTANCYA